ncbi:TonB-dependent siderophore receptor [Microbulbifer sp. ZKSA002]|uniref:TonB-dependent siderophore receptor n=1 Tax=Microbulbifer sp. ZKSA002 TaxID=3243388 RepID=UPI00403A115F
MSTARVKSMQKASPVISGISRSLLALAIATGGSSVAFAADNTDERIEEVNVTGHLNLSRQTSVGKLDVSVHETPFSVTVLDNDFFNDIGSKTVQDVLQYTPGVNGGTYGVDVRGDWSLVRGVDPAIFIDGLQSIFGSYTSARANLYAYDRIEVLKGPSSALYGQGSTGGIVNLVSKRPQREFGGEVVVQAGSYDHQAFATDVTGSMDSDGEWLYRVVGYKRSADTQVDYVNNDSTLLMPSISWRPSENTEITFQTTYQDDESGTSTAFLPWGGTRIDNANGDIPTDTFLSEPGWDKYNTEQTAYSIWADHRFSDNWGVNASIRYAKGEVDYNTMYGSFDYSRLNPNITEMQRVAFSSEASTDMLIFDLRMSGELTTGIVDHQVSFGLDSQDATTDNDYGYAYGGVINIFEPEYGYIPEDIVIANGPETDTEQLGFYFQDHMTIGNLIVTTGVRRDSTESQTEGSPVTVDDDATTMRLGVMYAFDMGISPYISYSESFEPVSGSDRHGDSFKPIEGEQVEVGVKYQPEGTNLLVTAAAYDIVQKNRLTTDPVDITFDTQTGEVSIDGVELEVTGKLGNLSLVAGYSTTNTEITESNVAGEVGIAIEAVPEELVTIWGDYDLSALLPGLSIGMGARHVGESYTGVEDPTGTFPSYNPSYTLYDASIGYTLDSWHFQLTGKNLSDEVHTTACLSRGDCFYGERRYVTAEARYIF